MKKLCLISLLVFGAILALATGSLGYGTENTPQSITVQTDSNLVNLFDGNTSTVCTYNKNGQDQIVPMNFSGLKYVDYFQVQGLTGKLDDCSFFYLDANGIWQPIIGHIHSKLINGIIDFSRSHVLTTKLKLIVHNSSNNISGSSVAENKVFGHDKEDLFLAKGIITASSENRNYPHGFITDGNTQTSWRSADNQNQTLDYTLKSTITLTQVKLFVKQGAGTATFKALVNDQWVSFGSSVDLSTWNNGWHTVSVPNLDTNEIKIEIVGNYGNTYLGGIAELQAWGETDRDIQQTISLGENWTGKSSFGVEIDDPSCLERAAIWVTFPTTVTDYNFSLKVNGDVIPVTSTVIADNGFNLVGVSLPISELRPGNNIITIDLGTRIATNCSLILKGTLGKIEPKYIGFAGNLIYLKDGYRFSGANAGLTSNTLDITWQDPASIDVIRLYGTYQTMGLTKVSIWQNNVWVPLNSSDWTVNGPDILITGGSLPTTKVRLEFSQSIMSGLNEVELYGSATNQQSPPEITILSPQSGQMFAQGSVIEITGYVDNPDALVQVDGNPVTLNGHYFSYSFTALINGSRVCQVTATDGQGQTGQSSVAYNVGQPLTLTCDSDEVTYTTSSQVTITGTVAGASMVKINSQNVAITSGQYSGTVTLEEGENKVIIEAYDINNAVVRLERRIIVDTKAPVVSIVNPINSNVSTPVLIQGVINDLSPTSVMIGDKAIGVYDGKFQASLAFPTNSQQTLVVTVTDSLGHVTTVNLSFSVGGTSTGTKGGGGSGEDEYVSPDFDNIAVLESAKDAPNPFGGYISSSSERVNSGNLSLSVTDLAIPGRNGLDLVIKRSYNSATAYSESTYEHNTHDLQKIPIKFFGGKGWALNIPYIYSVKTNGYTTKYIRLPEGQTVRLDEDLNGWEYHKGGISLRTTYGTVGLVSTKGLKVISSDGTTWVFDWEGKPISQSDPSGKSTIYFTFIGGTLDHIVDSAGRIVKFTYYPNQNLKSIILNGKTVVQYEYDSDNYLWKVYDLKNRVTEYNYSSTYNFLTSFYQAGFASYECNLKLVNQIKYPTGLVSHYDFSALSQNCIYLVWRQLDPNYEVGPPYTKENFYGMKFVVNTHKFDSTVMESYSYTFNAPHTEDYGDKLLPPNYYIEAEEIRSEKAKIVDTYIHLDDSNKEISHPTLIKYNGSMLYTRDTYKSINPDIEFEKVTYKYYPVTLNLIEEDHSRGNNSYTITYTCDKWNNILATTDSRTQVTKTIHYYGGVSYIHTLPSEVIEEVKNPHTGETITKSTLYTYNDPNNPTKPDSITVTDGNTSYTSTMTYDNSGDLKSRTVPVNTGVNLTVNFSYEYTYNAQNEIIACLTQESTMVTGADGTSQPAVGKYHCNYYGFIDWQMNPRGYFTAYRYDDLGRIVLKILPDDNDVPYVLPEYATNPNLPVSAIDNPVQTSIYYDELNQATFINENCQRTDYIYDDQGRVHQVTQYHNGTPQSAIIEYDAAGKAISVTDPRGVATSNTPDDYTTWYEYDGLGRVVKVIYPGETPGDKSAYVAICYDDINNMVTYTNPNGDVFAVEEYDMSQHLVRATNYSTFEGQTETYIWEYQYDSFGNKVYEKKPAIKDQETGQYLPPSEMTLEYHPLSNNLTKMALPESFGVVQPQTMDKGKLINPASPIQPVINYGLDFMGNRTQITDANGNITSFVYDELGRVIKTVQTFKQFNMQTGQEIPITVENVNKYDLAGNRIETRIGNKTWKYEYSARGQLLSETDPAGNMIQYRYDPLGNKIAVIDPRNSNTVSDTSQKIWYHFEGEGINRRLFIADPRSDKSYTTWAIYDDLNRQTRTVMPDSTPPTDPFKATTDFENPYTEITYDVVGNKLTVRDANGVVASNVYTPRNQIKETYINNNLKQKFEYDPAGNTKRVYSRIKDNIFFCTKMDYDSLGRVRRVTAPNGKNVVLTDYDAFGHKIQVKAGTIDSIQYSTVVTQYNQLGKAVWTRDPLGNKTQVRYDPNGNSVATIAANGLVSIARYDEFNRVVQAKDSLGISTWFSYDLNGNMVGMIDRRGTQWAYTFYANNLVQQIALTGINGSTYQVNYEYDKAGNRIKVWDTSPIGNTIIYNDLISDPLNRINSVERHFDNAAYRTEYQYNKGGQITALTYPGNMGTVTYHYDDENRLNEVVGFTQPGSVDYDQDGLLKTLTYTNGIKTTYNYDDNRRLKDLDTANGSTGIIRSSFTYDSFGNITNILDRITNQENVYTYDANNQLKSAVTNGDFNAQDPTPGTCGFEAFDYISKKQLNFSVQQDAVIRLDYASSSVGIDLGSAKSIVKLQVVPDASHSTHRLFNGSFDVYSSNDNSTYTLIPASQWDYQREPNGTIDIKFKQPIVSRYFKIHVKFDDRVIDFSADANKATFLNELAKMIRVYEGSTYQKEEYLYDAAGNRKQQIVSPVKTTIYNYSYYPDSDRLMTNDKYAFVYDNVGNVVEKGNNYQIQNNNQVIFTAKSGEGVEYWEYKYDLLNRLVEVKKNGTITAQYGYDPEGLRVVKWAHGDRIHYVYEGTEPIFEKRLSDGKVHNYIFGFGKYLARVDGAIGDTQSKVYYYHTDHLGSIKAVTDAQAKVVWHADYFAFGTRYKAEGSDGFDEWHGFTGKEYDPDCGLYYYNARWYDSELGRFISEDSVVDPANPNLYSYCGNNPLSRIDSTGHFWEYVIAAVIGALEAKANGGDTDDMIFGALLNMFFQGLSVGVDQIVQNAIGDVASQVVVDAVSRGITSAVECSITGGNSFKEFAIGCVTGGISSELSTFLPGNWYNTYVVSGIDGGLNSTLHGGNFCSGFGSGLGNSVIRGTLEGGSSEGVASTNSGSSESGDSKQGVYIESNPGEEDQFEDLKSQYIDFVKRTTGYTIAIGDDGKVQIVGERDTSQGNEVAAKVFKNAVENSKCIQIRLSGKEYFGDQFHKPGLTTINLKDYNYFADKISVKFAAAQFSHMLAEQMFSLDHKSEYTDDPKYDKVYYDAHRYACTIEAQVMGAYTRVPETDWITDQNHYGYIIYLFYYQDENHQYMFTVRLPTYDMGKSASYF